MPAAFFESSVSHPAQPARPQPCSNDLNQRNLRKLRPDLTLPPRPLRWLFLDLNSYFASVEQQLDPALRGKPLIVAPVGSETTVAIAASVEAKRYGISTGTPVWEAKRLCRDLLVAPARHDQYVVFHNAIVEEIWRHIPVTKVCSIDEVACQLLDNENSPEHAIALAQRIKAGILANVGECLTSSVGIAPNRLLAKLASDMQKPDGLVVLTADQLPQRLYDLKLRDICGIGANMERRLARDGVNDIRDLCERRPREAGSAWGGTNGDRLWYALHGVDLPDKPTQTRSIGHSHVLSPNRRGLEPVRLTARRLALKAASRLRRKGYVSRLLVLHVRFEDDKAVWQCSRKLSPTQDSFQVLAALDALFPRLAEEGRSRHGSLRVRMVGCDAQRHHAGRWRTRLAVRSSRPQRSAGAQNARAGAQPRDGPAQREVRAARRLARPVPWRADRPGRYEDRVRAHPRPGRIPRMTSALS